MNKKLTILAVALLTFGMAFSATAQNANNLEGDNPPNTTDGDTSQNESSNVTVSVASTTAIDVKPESLDYSSLDVGTQTTTGTSGGNSFGSIEVENIGSEYIDRIWAESTSPSSNPFGTGDPANYDAGNFLQVKPGNQSSKTSIRGNTSTYHYVNRYEFMNQVGSSGGSIPSYISADTANIDGGTPVQSYVGRFRAGDEWYFYTVYTDTADTCDGTANSYLRVGNSSHTPDSFGTVNFESSGSDYTTYDIAETGGSYGVATNGPAADTGVRLELSDGSYREYDVLTQCSGSNEHTIRTRYNVQAGDTNDLTAGSLSGDRTQFLLEAGSGSPSTMLLPGEGITIDTAIEVPQGVPQGSVQEGQITFYVTSDSDASVT